MINGTSFGTGHVAFLMDKNISADGQEFQQRVPQYSENAHKITTSGAVQ